MPVTWITAPFGRRARARILWKVALMFHLIIALTIEPGVTVELTLLLILIILGHIVDGSLFMEGSPDDHITIKAYLA